MFRLKVNHFLSSGKSMEHDIEKVGFEELFLAQNVIILFTISRK